MTIKKTEQIKKEALDNLNTELSKANLNLKKSETKVKAHRQAIGQIAANILNLQDKGLDASTLNASRKTKMELLPILETDLTKKNKIFTDLSDKIKALTSEIFRDEVISKVEEQESVLKLSVSEVTKLVLHLLKVTHSENPQILIEKISRNSSSFQ